MTIKKKRRNRIGAWLFTTFFLGCSLATLTSFIIEYFFGPSMIGDWSWIFIRGVLLSLVSIFGFFIYLFLNRSLSTWMHNRPLAYRFLQLALVILVYINFFNLQQKREGSGELWSWLFPLLFMVAALIVSFVKTLFTKSNTFIPTLFFMTTFTSIEIAPFLDDQRGTISWPFIFCAFITLFFCNAWQIVRLPAWIRVEEEQQPPTLDKFNTNNSKLNKQTMTKKPVKLKKMVQTGHELKNSSNPRNRVSHRHRRLIQKP